MTHNFTAVPDAFSAAVEQIDLVDRAAARGPGEDRPRRRRRVLHDEEMEMLRKPISLVPDYAALAAEAARTGDLETARAIIAEADMMRGRETSSEAARERLQQGAIAAFIRAVNYER